MENENIDFFPECEKCRKYDIGIPIDRIRIERIRDEIFARLNQAELYGTPANKPKESICDYEYCGECFNGRIQAVKEKSERGKDINFLTELGIDPKSILG